MFFIILCSLNTFMYISNISFTRKMRLLIALFALATTPIACFIWLRFPIYTVITITLLITIFYYIIFKSEIPQMICISVLSIGSSYALFALTSLIAFPVGYTLLLINIPSPIIVTILLFLIGCIQNILLSLVFHTKRLRNGIPGISTAFLGDIGVFIGALLILFSSALFFDSRDLISLMLIAFILALGVIIWLWWQKSIQTDYINKNNSQQIDILEGKLQERDAELERLSKIIHKDNKLLAALELSTREILQDASNEKAQSLLQELNRFSKERSETLHAYEAGQDTLPKTGLFSIDTMLNYLHQRALKHKIDFQLNLDDEISSITDVISEQDLSTLIADLGENAIIATKEWKRKISAFPLKERRMVMHCSFMTAANPLPQRYLKASERNAVPRMPKPAEAGLV